MEKLSDNLRDVNVDKQQPKEDLVEKIKSSIEASDYKIEEIDNSRPWGAFFRMANDQADRFIKEFFSGLSPEDARLGNPDLELSPKILLVSPEQRLSWQYHNRRAERWAYITSGGYFKSITDEHGEQKMANTGEVVQFAQGERHRLVGALGHYTLVAEIWQHLDPDNLSNEDDIVRVSDDYRR
jgi:mannose-6-phosphate isomerase-like protein (cupin superfamily)